MKFLRDNWQILVFLGLAVAGFLASPALLRLWDPSAGCFDAGYLQRPILGAVNFALAHAVAWVAFRIDWPTPDHWIDLGLFADAWAALTPRERLFSVIGLFFAEALLYLGCLWLVPV